MIRFPRGRRGSLHGLFGFVRPSLQLQNTLFTMMPICFQKLKWLRNSDFLTVAFQWLAKTSLKYTQLCDELGRIEIVGLYWFSIMLRVPVSLKESQKPWLRKSAEFSVRNPSPPAKIPGTVGSARTHWPAAILQQAGRDPSASLERVAARLDGDNTELHGPMLIAVVTGRQNYSSQASPGRGNRKCQNQQCGHALGGE